MVANINIYIYITSAAREGMNVINGGLPAIQGRNACDQLWVTGDTGDE
jgi:hypothetical protein